MITATIKYSGDRGNPKHLHYELVGDSSDGFLKERVWVHDVAVDAIVKRLRRKYDGIEIEFDKVKKKMQWR